MLYDVSKKMIQMKVFTKKRGNAGIFASLVKLRKNGSAIRTKFIFLLHKFCEM